MPIRATRRIYRTRSNGRRELAYAIGGEISDEDAIALGLIEKSAEKAAEKKAAPKPRAATRDRATKPRQ